MDSSKKTLIVHASAGHGHEKAALAVAEALAESGAEPLVRDALDHVWAPFGRSYKGTYLSLIKKAPALWGLCYYATDLPWGLPALRWVRRIVNRFLAAGLRRLFLSQKPDVLVCTHFMPVEVAGAMKRRGEFPGKIIAVITDYLPHAFWLDRSVDVYAVGGEETLRELVRRGVPKEKIAVTGIPTMRAFQSVRSAREARRDLGVSLDRPTALLTSGGSGVGPVGRVVRDLGADDFQLLVVCGTNRNLEEALLPRADARPLLRVFGFVRNMHELMTASDLVVGKAGGLTLAESFCLGVPAVMMCPVPGQEERNAQVGVAAGAGVVTRSAAETVNVVRSIFGNKPRLAEMKEAARRLGRPGAAQSVAGIALS